MKFIAKSTYVRACAILLLYVSGCVFASPANAQTAGEAHSWTKNPVVLRYLLTSLPPPLPDTVPMAFPEASETNAPGYKSPFLAAMLSLAIPGLGEYYIGDHIWRGMIFTGLEAGLWIEMFPWQQRYNNEQNSFYAYSDAHFSRGRYVSHLDSILLSDTQWVRTLYPQDHADSNSIASINRAEAALDSLKQIYPYLPDTDYTHRLIDPSVDYQQYNEMISKYQQYISGWDQIASWSTASSMRADAQHQYDIANDFLFGIFLNHALSAIDAALLARDHNTPIRLHGDILFRPYPDGTMGMIPTANIEYRF